MTAEYSPKPSTASPLPSGDLSGLMPTQQAALALQIGERLGLPRQDMLSQSGIDDAWLNIPDHQMSVAHFYALTKHIARGTKTEDIGIYIGRSAYHNIGHLLLYLSSICSSLRQWLNMMPSVLEMYGDLGKAVIIRENNTLRSEWRPNVPANASGRYTIDMVLSSANAILTTICLQPITIRKTTFTYPEPEDTSVLVKTFGSHLEFNQTSNALYFDMETLDYLLVKPDNPAPSHSQTPWQQYVDNVSGDSFLKAFRHSIVCMLPTGGMTIDSIAQDLSMSRRTLQRRLAERNTHFLHEVQELRSQMALRFLADPQLGITSIAFLLGYTDSSSFSTAFKSWHGCSPSEYRR